MYALPDTIIIQISLKLRLYVNYLKLVFRECMSVQQTKENLREGELACTCASSW